MQVNYKLNTDELDSHFLESIKLMFKNKNISISIIDEDDEDFALGKAMQEGLLSPSATREELNQALYVD